MCLFALNALSGLPITGYSSYRSGLIEVTFWKMLFQPPSRGAPTQAQFLNVSLTYCLAFLGLRATEIILFFGSSARLCLYLPPRMSVLQWQEPLHPQCLVWCLGSNCSINIHWMNDWKEAGERMVFYAFHTEVFLSLLWLSVILAPSFIESLPHATRTRSELRLELGLGLI